MEHRTLLLEDLAWLASLGGLKDSENLAQLLAVRKRPLTGAMLVAWLLRRVVIIAEARTRAAPNAGVPVVISGARPDLGLLVFDARPRTDRTVAAQAPPVPETEEDKRVSGFAREEHRDRWHPNPNWRTADHAHLERDAWSLGDRFLIATQLAYANTDEVMPTIYLTASFWRKYSGRTPADRVIRLATLFHEARHLDVHFERDAADHFMCQPLSWERASSGLRLGGIKTFSSLRHPVCDWYYRGPYGIDAALIRTLSRTCSACGARDLERMKDKERHSWRRVQFRLTAPAEIPALPVLRDNPGWTGLKIGTAPPKMFFTAVLESIDLRERRWEELFDTYFSDARLPHDPSHSGPLRREVAALSEWFDHLNRRGLIDPERAISRWAQIMNDDPPPPGHVQPDPDEADAVRWLKAVHEAAGEGYNVPLLWMPPCGKFRGGCELAASAAPPEPAASPAAPAPGWMGVTVRPVTAQSAQVHALRKLQGVEIVKVQKDAPADKAGVQVGDIILEVNGEAVLEIRDLMVKVAQAGAGASLELAYSRGDGSFGFTYVDLLPRPADRPVVNLWAHNGSTMSLAAEGRVHRFSYVEPRQGMKDQGVVPGAVLFEGESDGTRISGSAYIFSKRCGRSGYPVSGEISADQRRVTLRGEAPRLDAQCKVTGRRSDELVFQYVEAWPPAPAEAPGKAVSYRVSETASAGILDMRKGPGVKHPLVVGVPVGAGGVRMGACRPSDDAEGRRDWCEVEWRGFSGWASSCCLVPE